MMSRKTRKQLVGKTIENLEIWQREQEYEILACQLRRLWLELPSQGPMASPSCLTQQY
jgi:hypothetical protein